MAPAASRRPLGRRCTRAPATSSKALDPARASGSGSVSSITYACAHSPAWRPTGENRRSRRIAKVGAPGVRSGFGCAVDSRRAFSLRDAFRDGCTALGRLQSDYNLRGEPDDISEAARNGGNPRRRGPARAGRARERRDPGGAPRFQAAIDNSSPGDTIVVRLGTYHEYLQIVDRDRITLKGGACDAAACCHSGAHAMQLDGRSDRSVGGRSPPDAAADGRHPADDPAADNLGSDHRLRDQRLGGERDLRLRRRQAADRPQHRRSRGSIVVRSGGFAKNQSRPGSRSPCVVLQNQPFDIDWRQGRTCASRTTCVGRLRPSASAGDRAPSDPSEPPNRLKRHPAAVGLRQVRATPPPQRWDADSGGGRPVEDLPMGWLTATSRPR
jgi:hypothetical protein